jgi:anthranilate synthase/aminodeoxychorismate synthase-like glutamine amidotransferase
MLLLIDNYDSFTYNLYQYLSELGEEVTTMRNDGMTLDEIEKLAPARIVISPGPGRPEDAGLSNEIIQRFGERIPILGVCLGHQCIGQAYGGDVVHAGEIKHGKVSSILHDGKGVFKGLPNPFPAVRYHSLAIKKETLPDCIVISARTDNGIIMGVRHEKFPVEGVQFHPESYMTKNGKDLLKNFIRMGMK